eukprot:9318091-Ditylum_brightwellii.AAC.2
MGKPGSLLPTRPKKHATGDAVASEIHGKAFLYSCMSSSTVGKMQQHRSNLALTLMVLTSMSTRAAICNRGTQKQLQSHAGKAWSGKSKANSTR